LRDEFERGGMSGARFVALMGIESQTFANRVLRRRHQRPAAARSDDGVLPVICVGAWRGRTYSMVSGRLLEGVRHGTIFEFFLPAERRPCLTRPGIRLPHETDFRDFD
jgi:hypothetical protein